MGKYSYKVCCVCFNKSSDTDKLTKDLRYRISYHRVPMNDGDDRKEKWMEFCGYEKDDNIHSKFICSEHFSDDCFERDLKSELLDGVKKRMLCKNAIPTIKKIKKLKKKEKLGQKEKKKRKELVDNLLKADTYPVTIFQSKGTIINKTTQVIAPIAALPPMTEDQLRSRVIELERTTKAQQARITELSELCQRKSDKIELAKKEMVNINIALQNLKDLEHINLRVKVKEVLSKYLTNNQINMLLNKDKNVEWTSTEMQIAFTIRCFSKNSFIFLKNKLSYPLPTPTAMHRWVHNIYRTKGILDDAFLVMQINEMNLSWSDKQCVLLIGKTTINTKYELDRQKDQIIDHSSVINFIVVQGLFSEWKQVIHVDFDFTYTKEFLLHLVEGLYNINYNVVAVTCDCDTESLNLLKEFDVRPDKNYIAHPKTDNLIFFFICPLVLLTLIHAAIVDGGFIMEDCAVTMKPLIELMNVPSTKPLKITEQHLGCGYTVDQIAIVEELISQETADALKTNLPNDEEAGLLSTLLSLFTDWYDLSRTKCWKSVDNYINLPITKLPYGNENEDDQNIVLDGMFDTIENTRCVSDNNGILQYALLMTINSLKTLLVEIKRTTDYGAIATERLTMWSVYELISKFQMLGGNHLLATREVLDTFSNAIAGETDTIDNPSMTNKLLKLARIRIKNAKVKKRVEKHKLEFNVDDISEEDACSFLAGHIAMKLKPKYDYLGDYTFVIERKNNSYIVIPEDQTSKIELSGMWKIQAEKLEQFVTNVTFFQNEKVVESLVKKIAEKHPKMGKDIIAMYVEHRFIIKLNNLNKSLENGEIDFFNK